MAATVQPASSSLERAQYHHFIPRFILRNFSERGRNKKKDPTLRLLDLSHDIPKLVKSPVGRSFGISDMYRDFSRASDQHYLEKELSKLESRAGQIIANIRNTFESGNNNNNGGGAGVWLSRPERNTLRKFLFIMKYRGKGFHTRFLGDKTEGYVADDKKTFLNYMHRKGFQTPLDVWFASIKTILELEMDDAPATWQQHLMHHMYPMDACWFIQHTEWSYLTICTPDSADAEFVLTENSYNIFEGPNSPVGLWIPYHEFAPISPKLMIVLRSCLLPNPGEDANPEVRQSRQDMLRMVQSTLPDSSHAARSVLADLPVTKAQTSYASVGADGCMKLHEGEDGTPKSSHKFFFPFFKISTKHMDTINTVMLDNAYRNQAIAYKSKSALRSTIEHFITLRPDRGSFKLIEDDDPNNPRLVYLFKLEKFLRQMRSDKHLVYENKESLLRQFVHGSIHSGEDLEDEPEEQCPGQPSDFLELYMRLGGTESMLPRDLDQARRMVRLRVKIDVWTVGLAEDKRLQIRNKLGDILCQLPARRLWLYLKQFRYMHIAEDPERPGVVLENYPDLEHGPENALIRANNVIRPDKIGRLMHFAIFKHMYLLQNPEIDTSAPLGCGIAGLMHLRKISGLAFGHNVGSICHCGIPRIEEQARHIKGGLESTQYHHQDHLPVWTLQENIEMLTRLLVREQMEELLGDQLPSHILQKLKEVLFNIVYLTYNGQRK